MMKYVAFTRDDPIIEYDDVESTPEGGFSVLLNGGSTQIIYPASEYVQAFNTFNEAKLFIIKYCNDKLNEAAEEMEYRLKQSEMAIDLVEQGV